MSKLVIVLCATAFFASVSTHRNREKKEESFVDDSLPATQEIVYSAELAVINRETAHRRIEQAIEKVKERATEVYERVMQFGPRTGDEKVVHTFPYLRNIRDHLETISSFAEHYIASRNPALFDETKCKSYFLEYETLVKNHMEGLARLVSYEAYHEATMWIGKLLHEANNKTSKISELKARADTCNQFECNNVSKDARDICNSYFIETADALDYYQKMTNGSIIIDKLNRQWSYYKDLGQEVLQAIYDCVFNSE